jgi:glycosyltransferase involved in cell wall biosynthesis
MVALSLIEGFTNRGHEVVCAASSWNDGEFEKRLKKLSIVYSLIPLGFISRTVTWSALRMTFVQGMTLPALWWRYRRILRSFRPDVVVHSNFHHVSLLWPLFRNEINVFHVHDSFAPTKFHRWLFKFLDRRISLFVGVSSFIADTLLRLGLPENKVRFVLNGVTSDRSPADANGSYPKKNATLSDHSIRIGIVGQVDEWKGHEDLVEALHILQQVGQPFVCRIFGTGSPEFAAKLKAEIQHRGLTDRVEWMGFVSDRKFMYDQIDICVVPSRIHEAFGMAAAEASSYGVPVVASRKGALPEIVADNLTGYLVDAGAPEQIAKRICDLAVSPATRREMSKRGQAHIASSLGAEKMIERMEALLIELTHVSALGTER